VLALDALPAVGRVIGACGSLLPLFSYRGFAAGLAPREWFFVARGCLSPPLRWWQPPPVLPAQPASPVV